jgi:O-antigen/teichoic acid export membrane protein
LGALLACLVASPWIVRLMFGARFAETALLLPFYALAMTSMAYNWIFANYFLAIGRFTYLWGMGVAVVIYCVGLALFHATVWHLVAVLGTSGILLLAWNLFLLSREAPRRAARTPA